MPPHTDPLAAGQAALAAADWAAASDHLTTAVRQTGAPEAHDGLGLALWWLNDVPGAHHARTQAFLGYKARGDDARAARLAAWLAREQIFLHGNASAMQGWFARAESLLADSPESAAHGWVRLYRATMTADLPAMDATAAAVSALARRHDDDDLAAFALVNGGYAAVAQGRVAEGMAMVDEAMIAATSGEVGDIFVVTEIFCVTLSACELAGDLARTRHWCEMALAYAERYNAPFLSAYCRTTYGGLLAAAGQWPDAEAALDEAIAIFDEGHQGLKVHAVLKLAELRLDQGRPAEAAALLAGQEDRDAAVIPLARLHLAQGRPDAARALVDHALAVPSPALLARVPLLATAVDIALAQNDVAAARRRLDALADVAAKAANPQLTARVNVIAGRLRLAAGEPGAADAFHAALAALQGLEDSLLAARAKLALARTLQATDPAGAAMWARAARAAFDRLGARPDARDAATLLGALEGERPGPRSDPLTPREAEVAALVAEGLTNKEIASRLVIAPKTVEHHVGHILAKLALRRRTEVAAYFARQRGK